MVKDSIFRCVVEDVNDPEFLGRVRLRVLGVHSPLLDLVPVASLPWCDTLKAPDNGSGLGWSSQVQQGVWGYCLALNNSNTEFLFLGALNGKFANKPAETNEEGKSIGFRDIDGKYPPEKSLGKPPVNALALGSAEGNSLSETAHQKINDNLTEVTGEGDTPKEPESTDDKTVYPFNKVYEDLAGNVIEIDSTEGNERIRVYHGVSGGRVEFDKEGNYIVKTTGNQYNLTEGELNQQIKGLFSIDAKGNLIITGDVKIEGSIEITKDLTADNVITKTDVADAEGSLKALRDDYTLHQHTGNLGAPTSPLMVPFIPIPLTPFTWTK